MITFFKIRGLIVDEMRIVRNILWSAYCKTYKNYADSYSNAFDILTELSNGHIEDYIIIIFD